MYSRVSVTFWGYMWNESLSMPLFAKYENKQTKQQSIRKINKLAQQIKLKEKSATDSQLK